jgi:hypothetical protein
MKMKWKGLKEENPPLAAEDFLNIYGEKRA